MRAPSVVFRTPPAPSPTYTVSGSLGSSARHCAVLSRREEFDLPAVRCLIEAGERRSGRRVQTCHTSMLPTCRCLAERVPGSHELGAPGLLRLRRRLRLGRALLPTVRAPARRGAAVLRCALSRTCVRPRVRLARRSRHRAHRRERIAAIALIAFAVIVFVLFYQRLGAIPTTRWRARSSPRATACAVG